MRALITAIVILVACAGLTVGTSWAEGAAVPLPATSTVICNPSGCFVVVKAPGKKQHTTHKTTNNKTTNNAACVTRTGTPVPCHDPTLGYFNNRDGCYYKLHVAVLHVRDDPTQKPPPGKKQGAWYDITCIRGNGVPVHTVQWLPAPPVQQITVTPAELAKQALAQLRIPRPTTGRGPGGTLKDGRPYSLVRAYTWFWTDPTKYKPLSKRASAGAVWAEVTVRPSALTFAPGDGTQTVSCSGPGTPWIQGKDSPWVKSPTGCDYSYPHSTYQTSNGELTATYGIVWKVRWIGSGGAGASLPNVTTTTQSQFAVAEAEAVVVN